jgi:hypothetical protein
MSSKRKNRPMKLPKSECSGEYENGSGIIGIVSNTSDNYLNHRNKYMDDDDDEDNDDISSDNGCGDESDVDVEDNHYQHTIKHRDINKKLQPIEQIGMSSSDSGDDDEEYDDNSSTRHSPNNYGIIDINSAHIFSNNIINSNKYSKQRSMDDVLKKLTSKMPKCEANDKKIM